MSGRFFDFLKSFVYGAVPVLVLLAGAVTARGDVAFLMEEPYGGFGSVNPTGHGALYFNHICAETPTQLRMCHPGELGAVVSRYHNIKAYDWIAIPVLPYLYAVERKEDVPMLAGPALRSQLRDEYRRKHLQNIASDVVGEDGQLQTPKGDWIQLVGSSYDRKIYGFQIETTAAEDERFIAQYNDHRNISHFNLFFHNCADFSRVALNSYFPHAIRRNYMSDFGLTTPKQVAKSLEKYAKKNPETPFTVFVIPQVQGTIPRSHRIDGVGESLLKSKKYVVPLAVFYPEFTGALGVTYLAQGRFSPPKDAPELLLPGEDARAIVARREEAKRQAMASVDAHGGVDVEDKAGSLDDHGVNLERGEGEGVAGSLGGSTE
jgi:hypothetical protein